MASTPSATTTDSAASTGRFMTPRTQRKPMVGFDPSSCTVARLNARDPRFGVSRPLASPRSAGTRVVATPMAMSTAKAAPTPMTLRNGMLTTSSPSRAMITVIPANTTAVPAVPTAVAADSSGVSPWASWVRCRDRMNRE